MHYECFNAHANGAMQWMTSFLPTNLKEVRAATTLLYLNVFAVPVLAAPIWLWFFQMHLQYESAKV